MKQIIRRKKYDTETAEEIGSCSYGNSGDFRHFEESLYRKTTGEFFIAGTGGPLTKYAESFDGKTRWSGSKIIPLTLDEAMDWVEENMSANAFERVFGEVEE